MARDIEAFISTLQDKIINLLHKESQESGPRPATHAERDKQRAAQEDIDITIRSAIALVGCALADLRRIADALDEMSNGLDVKAIILETPTADGVTGPG